MKKVALLALALMLVAGVYHFMNRPAPRTAAEGARPDAEPADGQKSDYAEKKEDLKSGEPRAMPSENVTTANGQLKQLSPEAREAGKKPIMDIVPNLQAYKDEIAANPHGAPPSLRRFAEAMAAKMEPALKDENAAKSLVPELGECVKSASVTAAQQTCLVNAKRLAKIHPRLAGDVKSIEDSAPNDVKRRAMLLDPDHVPGNR